MNTKNFSFKLLSFTVVCFYIFNAVAQAAPLESSTLRQPASAVSKVRLQGISAKAKGGVRIVAFVVIIAAALVGLSATGGESDRSQSAKTTHDYIRKLIGEAEGDPNAADVATQEDRPRAPTTEDFLREAIGRAESDQKTVHVIGGEATIQVIEGPKPIVELPEQPVAEEPSTEKAEAAALYWSRSIKTIRSIIRAFSESLSLAVTGIMEQIGKERAVALEEEAKPGAEPAETLREEPTEVVERPAEEPAAEVVKAPMPIEQPIAIEKEEPKQQPILPAERPPIIRYRRPSLLSKIEYYYKISMISVVILSIAGFIFGKHTKTGRHFIRRLRGPRPRPPKHSLLISDYRKPFAFPEAVTPSVAIKHAGPPDKDHGQKEEREETVTTAGVAAETEKSELERLVEYLQSRSRFVRQAAKKAIKEIKRTQGSKLAEPPSEIPQRAVGLQPEHEILRVIAASA